MRILVLIAFIFLGGNGITQQDLLLTGQEVKEDVYANDTLLGPSIQLSFVGSGNFQRNFSSDAEMDSNAGIGMIFFRRWQKQQWIQDLQLDLHINVAAATDSLRAVFDSSGLTNRREFGRYLLQPYNSKQAANFNLQLYFGKTKMPKLTKWLHGVSARFYASNSSWYWKETKIDLTGIAFRLGVFHDFAPDFLRYEKGYSIILGMDYSFRGLYGDLATSQNRSIRTGLLGTGKTSFHGIEIYFGFQLKNIKAEVLIPVFRKNGTGIPGLTNTQFITALRFVGGFPVHIDGYGYRRKR